MQDYSIIIFLSVIALCYLLHIPKAERQLSILEVENAVKRLKIDFSECETYEQLKRLEKFMAIIVLNAKAVDPNYLNIERDLWNCYTIHAVHLKRNCATELIPYIQIN